MDASIPIPHLLDQVKAILASQNPNLLTTPTAHPNGHANMPILPPSIPTKLPSHLTHLSLSSSDPLTHAIQTLQTHILPHLNLGSLSPRYYGFVTGGVTPAALIADILVSIYDQNVHVHLPRETIATAVEVAALNLLVDLFNLPGREWGVGTRAGNGGGVFTMGATGSNILGLGLGREFVLRFAAERAAGGEPGASCGEMGILKLARLAGVDQVVVLSTLPHSSITKAASVVGIGRENVVDISIDPESSDVAQRLNVDIERLRKLAERAREDRTAYILTLSAGEINTGRFAGSGLEDMRRIREICDRYGIWIHVDGAFGLFARVLMSLPTAASTPTSQAEPQATGTSGTYDTLIRGVSGIELADSITSDGHKLLNVPYDCGIFFTRHKRLSEDVFRNGNAAYLTSTAATPVTSGVSTTATTTSILTDDADLEIQSPLNITLENSRRFRALPVFTTLTAYGLEGYASMLLRQITLARRVALWMLSHPDIAVLPLPPSPHVTPEQREEEVVGNTFISVLFRAADAQVNETLVARINDTGRMYVSGTVWEGRKAARMAVSNWRVDVERDLKVVVEVVEGVVGRGKTRTFTA